MFYNHKRWLAPDMSRKRNVLLFYCSTLTSGAKEATHSAVGAGDQEMLDAALAVMRGEHIQLGIACS